MTFSEVLEIGKAKLVEYGPRMKTTGHKPYSSSAMTVRMRYEGSLVSASREGIEYVVAGVLDQLVDWKNGFTASEPELFLPSQQIESDIVTHNDIALRFAYVFSIFDDTSYLWVTCWYQPNIDEYEASQ